MLYFLYLFFYFVSDMLKKILLTFAMLVSIWMTCVSTTASDDITSNDFEIRVGEMTPGGTDLIKDGSGETVNNFLEVVLSKLIIVFWVVAVFIMTIGAGYMILYHGEDDLLSKGKTIFISGIISLAIALSAWVIVNLFAYLLY